MTVVSSEEVDVELQWFSVTLAGTGRRTLPLPGARDVDVEDWTELSVLAAGERRVALDSRCQNDDVGRRRLLLLASSSTPTTCVQQQKQLSTHFSPVFPKVLH